MVFCKRCHDKAVQLGMLEAIKKLARKGYWFCPFLKKKCGKDAA